MMVAPGGVIGAHPSSGHQVMLVVGGSGWVAGADGVRVPVTVGQGAYWVPGEMHTTGTDVGLTAIAIDGGGSVTVFEPE